MNIWYDHPYITHVISCGGPPRKCNYMSHWHLNRSNYQDINSLMSGNCWRRLQKLLEWIREEGGGGQVGTQEGKCPTLLYIFLLWLAPRHNHRSINTQISMNASENTGHLHWLHSSLYRDSLQSQSAKIYNLSSMSWACRSYPKKRHLGGILVWCQCHLSGRLSVKRNSNSTLSLSHMTKLDTLWLRLSKDTLQRRENSFLLLVSTILFCWSLATAHGHRWE